MSTQLQFLTSEKSLTVDEAPEEVAERFAEDCGGLTQLHQEGRAVFLYRSSVAFFTGDPARTAAEVTTWPRSTRRPEVEQRQAA